MMVLMAIITTMATGPLLDAMRVQEQKTTAGAFSYP
jgi:hypothetical protein